MLHDLSRSNLKPRTFLLVSCVALGAIAVCCMPLLGQEEGKSTRNNATNPFVTPQQESPLLTDVIDDRAIKKLISTRAEALLPDPQMTLF